MATFSTISSSVISQPVAKTSVLHDENQRQRDNGFLVGWEQGTHSPMPGRDPDAQLQSSLFESADCYLGLD